MGLGKVCQNLYVWGIGLFSYLTYVHFWKFSCWTIYHWLCKQNIMWQRWSGVCENEKRKRCNRIPSDITLGRKLRYCRIRVPGEFGTIFITLSRLKGRMFKLNNICMALFMKIVCFQIYKTNVNMLFRVCF